VFLEELEKRKYLCADKKKASKDAIPIEMASPEAF
jgi:hypothetical protein